MAWQHYNFIFGVSVVITFLGDRITKMLALEHLTAGPVALFDGCRFSLMFNSGISFSLFSSPSGVISWYLTALIAGIVALLVVAWRFYATSRLGDIGFGFIIGGAIGNFVDRLCIGGVIDFIELHYKQWAWPTFNVADIVIVVGFLLVAGEAWYEGKV